MTVGELEMRETLTEMLYESADVFTSILSFEEAGVMTRNEGLVVRTSGGDEFQIMIVRSAWGDDNDDNDDQEEGEDV